MSNRVYNRPGVGNVGSYQVSGYPYLTGSAIDGFSEVKIEFPTVAKSVKVKSISGDEIRVHFTSKDEGDTYLSGRYKTLESSGSVVTLDSKCKEIYVSNHKSSSVDGFVLFAELTHIGTGSMYSLTGTVNLSGSDGFPIPQGVTGWWTSTNVDGSNNNTLSDGERVSTWVDQSNNGYDLTAYGNLRPYYEDADNSGQSPTFPIVDFYETGPEEHFMTRIGTDFEDILPTAGKSTYVVVYFEGNVGSYGGGSNKGLQPRLVSASHYPIRWGLEYARYSNGGANWDVVFVQDDTIIDSVQIGTGVSQPSANGRFIFSFRQGANDPGNDNYFLSCYNANATFTNSTQGEVADTPDCSFFRVRFTFIPKDMEFFEIITFNRKLTDEEDAAMVAYLNNKWDVGVSL